MVRFRNSSQVWLVLVVSAATVVAGAKCTPAPSSEILYLNEAADWDRAVIYHKDEGVRLFPYDWFLTLERADSSELFASDANIRRYAFLPDAYDARNNRDRLPVGFTRYDPSAAKPSVDDEFACETAQGAAASPVPQLGFNCAACHTSELRYTPPGGGRQIVMRVEGGPSMQNNLQFFKDLFDALKATVSNNEKFGRFAARLHYRLSKSQRQQAPSPKELGACVAKYLLKKHSESYNGAYPTYESLFPSPWGFGRLDAFGRGGNTAFAKLDPANLRPADAPVSFPPLWNVVWSYDRVQWNGAIHDLKARFIAQALGLNAPVRLSGDPGRIFETGFDLHQMDRLAKQYKNIPPPAWPSQIFDDGLSDIERVKLAGQGKTLYAERCAGCHAPIKKDPDGRYELHMISLSDIGTDPVSITRFIDRTVKTGPLSGVFKAEMLPAAEVIERLTTGIMKKNGIEHEANQNKLKLELGYLARPHAGIWATPPFLHNGSIPNLYLLLSPQEERDAKARTFCLGDLEFDPDLVGFKLKRPPCLPGESLFDTTLPGNRNTGHEFRNEDRAGRRFDDESCKKLLEHGKEGILGCELTRDERMALITYMKSL